MARKQTPPPRNPRRGAKASDPSLIDWREPERNADVLDWRRRAHEFGLVPVDDGEPPDAHVVPPADRLLREEDAEAFDDQPIADAEGDDPNRDAEDQPIAAGVSARGTGSGARVSQPRRQAEAAQGARGAGDRPAHRRRARRTAGRTGDAPLRRPAPSLSLAEHVKRGSAPAAELILLPDGGELKPENIEPVSGRFDGSGSARADRRVPAPLRTTSARRWPARAAFRKTIAEVQTAVRGRLRGLPLRPSLIDQIFAALREVDRGFDDARRDCRATSRTARPARARGARRACRADGSAAPLQHREQHEAARASKPSVSCSRRTCGWSSRSPSAT